MKHIFRAKQGNAAFFAVFVLIILIAGLAICFDPTGVQNNLKKITVNLKDGLQVVETKSYPICKDVSWTQIKAAGIKVTETSLDGFLQLCQRLAINVGNFKVYADVECRVLWVYCPSQAAANSEAYYVQFT